MSYYNQYAGPPSPYAQQNFMEQVKTKEGQDKYAYFASAFVREKLREFSWAEKIQPPEQLNPQQLVPGVNVITNVQPTGGVGSEDQGDTYYIIRDLEPDATAMPLNFRGMPDARYVHGRHYAIPIGTWASELHQKSEQELAASSFDILKVIEQLDVREIATQKDTLYKRYVDAAITTTGKALTATGPMTRALLSRMAVPIIKDQLRPYCYLMSDAAFNDMLEWNNTDLGDSVAQLTVNGYTYDKIFGRMFIRSLKSDMFDTYDTDGSLASTTIYLFTSPDALGHAFQWGQTKMWSDWTMNMFSWACWEDGGFGIGNIRGMVKLTLTY